MLLGKDLVILILINIILILINYDFKVNVNTINRAFPKCIFGTKMLSLYSQLESVTTATDYSLGLKVSKHAYFGVIVES